MIKQTSLQFFAMSLYDYGLLTGNGDIIQDLLDQAREMYNDEMEAAIIKQCAEESTSTAHKKEIHRQQIIAAYKAAMHTQYLESHTYDQQGHVIHKADDYYNKTYNTK